MFMFFFFLPNQVTLELKGVFYLFTLSKQKIVSPPNYVIFLMCSRLRIVIFGTHLITYYWHAIVKLVVRFLFCFFFHLSGTIRNRYVSCSLAVITVCRGTLELYFTQPLELNCLFCEKITACFSKTTQQNMTVRVEFFTQFAVVFVKRYVNDFVSFYHHITCILSYCLYVQTSS